MFNLNDLNVKKQSFWTYYLLLGKCSFVVIFICFNKNRRKGNLLKGNLLFRSKRLGARILSRIFFEHFPLFLVFFHFLGLKRRAFEKVEVNVFLTNLEENNYFLSALYHQCDEIGRFIAFWSTFLSLWQQLFSPDCHILGNFSSAISFWPLFIDIWPLSIDIWPLSTGHTVYHEKYHLWVTAWSPLQRGVK